MALVRMDTLRESLDVLVAEGLDADTARKLVDYTLKLEEGELSANPQTHEEARIRNAFLFDGTNVLGKNGQPIKITPKQALALAKVWDTDTEERREQFFPPESALEALAKMADNIPRAVRNGRYSGVNTAKRTSGQVCAEIISKAPHLTECFEITREGDYIEGPISRVRVIQPTVPQEGSVPAPNEVTLTSSEYSVK